MPGAACCGATPASAAAVAVTEPWLAVTDTAYTPACCATAASGVGTAPCSRTLMPPATVQLACALVGTPMVSCSAASYADPAGAREKAVHPVSFGSVNKPPACARLSCPAPPSLREAECLPQPPTTRQSRPPRHGLRVGAVGTRAAAVSVWRPARTAGQHGKRRPLWRRPRQIKGQGERGCAPATPGRRRGIQSFASQGLRALYSTARRKAQTRASSAGRAHARGRASGAGVHGGHQGTELPHGQPEQRQQQAQRRALFAHSAHSERGWWCR